MMIIMQKNRLLSVVTIEGCNDDLVCGDGKAVVSCLLVVVVYLFSYYGIEIGIF